MRKKIISSFLITIFLISFAFADTPTEGSHRIYYDSNDNPLYEGWALKKAASTAGAVWKIKKYTWTTGTGGAQVMTYESWAGSNENYDKKLDDRTGYTYN